MDIKITDIIGYGSAGDGFTYVAYRYQFNQLTCDHQTKGTIAIDLYNRDGKLVDGMTCCDKCVDGGMELWHVSTEGEAEFATTNAASLAAMNAAHIADNDAAERYELAGETDEETALRRSSMKLPQLPRFSFRNKKDKTIPMPNFSDTDR